jgi:caffeoyl-CoA O-methyltransferase
LKSVTRASPDLPGIAIAMIAGDLSKQDGLEVTKNAQYTTPHRAYWRVEGRKMFQEITKEMQQRMTFLEDIDKKDRNDGTEKLQRLRQILPETGKFIALLAANCPKGDFVEIGTSAGYSTLWISLALKDREEKIKTFEILPEKAKLARITFSGSNVSDKIELIEGDFLKNHACVKEIAFCFLDCEKNLYEKCFELVSEKLIKGGLLIADNAINHYESIKGMIQKAENDNRFDCLTVPVGKGEFLCRRK